MAAGGRGRGARLGAPWWGPTTAFLGLAAREPGAGGRVVLSPPAGALGHLPRPRPARARRRAPGVGHPLAELGDPADPATLAEADSAAAGGRSWSCATAVVVDRFGNVELLAGAGDLERAGFARGDRISAATGERRHPATVAMAFGDVPHKGNDRARRQPRPGGLAVNGGSAAARLPASAGDGVTLARW